MIYHDLQYFCTKHICFPALLYHFWQVSRGVKVHRTTAALGLGVQRWWTKAAAQSNSRWSRWNLWLSHVGYTVMLDWICFKEHVYVFNWYLGIHVRACVCVCACGGWFALHAYTHIITACYMISTRGVCGMTRFLFGIWIRSPGHESYWSKKMWWHGQHEKVFALNRRGWSCCFHYFLGSCT